MAVQDAVIPRRKRGKHKSKPFMQIIPCKGGLAQRPSMGIQFFSFDIFGIPSRWPFRHAILHPHGRQQTIRAATPAKDSARRIRGASGAVKEYYKTKWRVSR